MVESGFSVFKLQNELEEFAPEIQGVAGMAVSI